MDKKQIRYHISPKDDERYEQDREDRMADFEPDYEEDADDEE